VRLASEGRKVALISSGDAGIYGMAGLVLEIMEERHADASPLAGGRRAACHLAARSAA